MIGLERNFEMGVACWKGQIEEAVLKLTERGIREWTDGKNME